MGKLKFGDYSNPGNRRQSSGGDALPMQDVVSLASVRGRQLSRARRSLSVTQASARLDQNGEFGPTTSIQ